MAQQVVTELIVDARGASKGSDDYVRSMQRAEAAQNRVRANNDNLDAAIKRQGLAFSTVEPSVSRYAKAFDALRARIDPAFAAQQKFEAGARTVDAALKRGIATEQQAALALDRLAAKYGLAGTAATQAAIGQARLSTAVGVVNTVAAGLGITLGAAGVFRLAQAGRQAVQELGDLADAAERASVSAERLQVFRYAFEQTTGSAEQADEALKKFNVSLGEAANTGKGKAAVAFRALGIEVEDAAGNIRDNNSALDEVIERLGGVDSPARRAALATAIFGKQVGPDLAALLGQGAAGIEEFRKRMIDLGILMSDDMIKAGDALDNRFKEISRQIDTAWKRTVIDLADAFFYLTDAMRAVENQQSLAQLTEQLGNLAAKRGEIVDQMNEVTSRSAAERSLVGGALLDLVDPETWAALDKQLKDVELQMNKVNDRLLKLTAPVARPAYQRTPDGADVDFGRGSSATVTTSDAFDIRPEIARSTAAMDGLNDRLKDARGYAEDFTRSLVSGLIRGESLMGTLASSLENVSAKLTDSAITDLFSGNFASAAIKGIGAVVTSLLGNAARQAEEREKAREEFRAAEDDIAALRGLLMGEVPGALAETIRQTAEKVDAYVEVMRKAGAKLQADKLKEDLARFTDVLRKAFGEDLRAKINDARGLDYLNAGADLAKELATLRTDARTVGADLGQIDRYAVIAAQGIVDQYKLTGSAFDRLMKAFPGLTGAVHEFAETADAAAVKARRLSLQDRLFAARNDTVTLAGQLKAFDRDAERQRREEIAAGGQAIALLEKTLAAERMNIVRAFNRDALEEQKRAAAEQRAAMNQSARSIVDYVNSLRTGPETTLSPQDRLTAAQSAFGTQIALAQGGNAGAQASITEYADAFIGAAREFWASAPEFQTIFQSVQDQLLALPAVQQTTDPVVVALRDVLTGVDATTAAVNLMAATLATAIEAGPAATAAALGDAFENIDINASGGITFAEMQTAVGGLATNAAIQTVFNAVDLNRNQTVSRLELLLAEQGATRTGLAAAINGGPATTAAALSPLFTTLDTTMKGRLSFAEFRSGLTGLASDARLQQIFAEMDVNGDGQLTKLELIRLAAGSTTKAVGASNDLIRAVKSNTQAAEAELINSGKELKALKGLNASTKTVSETISTSINQLGKQSQVIALDQNNKLFLPMRLALNKMANNVDKSEAKWWNPFTWFSEGGTVTGGIAGRDSVPTMLMPGEFVVRADVARRNMPQLEALNRGAAIRMPAVPDMGASISAAIGSGFAGLGATNDNGRWFMEQNRVLVAGFNATIAALREENAMLRASIERLEQSMSREARRKPVAAPATKVA